MAQLDDLHTQFAAAIKSGDTATANALADKISAAPAPVSPPAPVSDAPTSTGDATEQKLLGQISDYAKTGDKAKTNEAIKQLAMHRTVQKVIAAHQGGSGAAEAFGLGAGHGFGDVGDYVGGLTNAFQDFAHGSKSGLTAGDWITMQRQAREGIEQAHPVSSFGGEAAGAVSALAAGGAALRAAAPAVPAAITAAFPGAPVTAGIAQTALGAGALAGEQKAAEGGSAEDVVQTAGINAGAAPVAGEVAKVLAMPVRFAVQRLAATNGFQALAANAGMPINQLVATIRANARAFIAQNGHEPALGEVLPKPVATEAGSIIKGRAQASQTAQNLEPALNVQRQVDTANAIQPGSGTTSDVTGKVSDAAFAALRPVAVPTAPAGPVVKFLSNPDVQRVVGGLTDDVQQEVAAAQPRYVKVPGQTMISSYTGQKLVGPTTTKTIPGKPITVGTLDLIRKALNASGDSTKPGLFTLAQKASDLADGVTGGKYSAAVRMHARNALRENAAVAAKKSVTGELPQSVNPGTNSEAATSMTEALGPAETARVAAVAKGAENTAANVAEIVPASAPSRLEGQIKAAKAAIDVPLAIKGRTGGLLGVVSNTLRQFHVGRVGADDLAQRLLDPQRFAGAVADLEALGVSKATTNGILRKAGAVASVATRPQGSQEPQDGVDTASTTELPVSDQTASATLAAGGVAPSDQSGALTGAPDDVSSAITKAAAATGVSADYLAKTAKRESGFRADVPAKGSSATGLFQFTEGSWLKALKDAGGKFAELADEAAANPATNADVLSLRNDPDVAAHVAALFTKANSDYLAKALGRTPTDGELYAAHFLGAAGAKRLILASQGSTVAAASLFPPAARANRAMFYNNGKAISAKALLSKLTADSQ